MREAFETSATSCLPLTRVRWPTAGLILTPESPCDTKSNAYRNNDLVGNVSD